jgi:hypothetical protein
MHKSSYSLRKDPVSQIEHVRKFVSAVLSNLHRQVQMFVSAALSNLHRQVQMRPNIFLFMIYLMVLLVYLTV